MEHIVPEPFVENVRELSSSFSPLSISSLSDGKYLNSKYLTIKYLKSQIQLFPKFSHRTGSSITPY